MIKKLQKKYALSEQGAKDLIKGCLACVLQNLSFMFPVGLLYYLVSDLMNGGVPGGKIPFYVAGCVVCIGLILLTTLTPKIRISTDRLIPVPSVAYGTLFRS